jgi:hypothetical protein
VALRRHENSSLPEESNKLQLELQQVFIINKAKLHVEEITDEQPKPGAKAIEKIHNLASP